MIEPAGPETFGTVERLREALIDLERSRRRERELRQVEASLLDVVRVLAHYWLQINITPPNLPMHPQGEPFI